MKTFKEFAFQNEMVNVQEGQNVDVFVIDELEKPTNFVSIEMEKGYKSYAVNVDPEAKTCWVKIDKMNWAKPCRFEDFTDTQNFKPYVMVGMNPRDYNSFDYWLNYWRDHPEKIPDKVKTFKPKEEITI